MRDIPRYGRLIEKGTIDAKSMITRRYTLDQGRQSVQDTADRTIMIGVIECSQRLTARCFLTVNARLP